MDCTQSQAAHSFSQPATDNHLPVASLTLPKPRRSRPPNCRKKQIGEHLLVSALYPSQTAAVLPFSETKKPATLSRPPTPDHILPSAGTLPNSHNWNRGAKGRPPRLFILLSSPPPDRPESCFLLPQPPLFFGQNLSEPKSSPATEVEEKKKPSQPPDRPSSEETSTEKGEGGAAGQILKTK